MAHHLVVLHPKYLREIFAGRKRIECRLSVRRQPVFRAARRGDVMWFKLPAGPVQAVGRIGRARVVELEGAAALRELAGRYGAAVGAPPEFWNADRPVRCAGLFWIERIAAVRPFTVVKRDRNGWVRLAAAPRPGRPLPKVAAQGARRASRSRPRSSPTKLKN